MSVLPKWYDVIKWPTSYRGSVKKQLDWLGTGVEVCSHMMWFRVVFLCTMKLLILDLCFLGHPCLGCCGPHAPPVYDLSGGFRKCK